MFDLYWKEGKSGMLFFFFFLFLPWMEETLGMRLLP